MDATIYRNVVDNNLKSIIYLTVTKFEYVN